MDGADLDGKVALITGASSGIGEAVAHSLSSRGMHVVLVARREERIRQLADALGDRALPLVADVCDELQVHRVFNVVKERFGGLDLLVNNAGTGMSIPFAQSLPEHWKAQIDTNIYGTLHCTHAALQLMGGRPGAMVAFVGSVASQYGFAGSSLYCATKHAIRGFQDSLRKELGQEGIRVTLVDPAQVRTEWGGEDPGVEARRQEVGALAPDDVAEAILFAFSRLPNILIQSMTVRPVRQITP